MARIQWRFLTLLFAVLQLFFFPEVLINAESMSSAFGEAERSLEPENQGLDKRQGSFIPVQGAQSSNGRCCLRRNIEILQRQYPDEINMLLLALSDLQIVVPSGDFSWFGVGGIHGAPYIPWQQPPEESPFNTGLGCGVHFNPLFSLWHRPYIDWSDIAYEGRIPAFIMSPIISVTWPLSPSGMPQIMTIRNPLYRYDFRIVPEERRQHPGIWGIYWFTTRAPESVSRSPISRDDLVDLAMRNTFIPRH